MFNSRYPENFFEHERYPFTDFYNKENPVPWIYAELGILKEWEISLTRLLTRLAVCEDDDMQRLVNEIKDLLDKLQNFEKLLADALNALKLNMADSENTLLNGFGKLKDFIVFVGDFINALNPYFKDLFDDILNRFKTDEDNIAKNADNIYELFIELENVYEFLIMAINDSFSYITLTEGVDYNRRYFNNFYDAGNTPTRLRRAVNTFTLNDKTILSVRYLFSSGEETTSSGKNSYSMSNTHVFSADDTYETAPSFKHSYSIDLRPTCKIIEFEVIDDYFGSSKYSIKNSNFPSDTSIWNITPDACWGCTKKFNRGYTSGSTYISGGRYLTAYMSQISDGINNQYYSSHYTSNGQTLSCHTLNMATVAEFTLE